MIDISVIVPVYNVEKYLPKCLESLIAQDECVKEIILINDGSTDNSLKVCQEYAQKDSRIRIINQENKGASAAIYTGVISATCEYIGFADGDDYLEPDMYRLMAHKLLQSGADIVFCDYDTVSVNGEKFSHNSLYIGAEENIFIKKNGSFSIQILPTLKDGRYLIGYRWNKLFKKKNIIENIAFKDFKIRHGEDIALIVPIIFAAEKIACVHQSLYHYLQRDDSIVHSYKRQNLQDWSLIIDILDKAHHEYEYKLENFDNVSLALLLSLCLYKLKISSLSLKQKKEEYKFIGENERVRDLLSKVKLKTKLKYKIVYNLLKFRMYGLLSLIY